MLSEASVSYICSQGGGGRGGVSLVPGSFQVTGTMSTLGKGVGYLWCQGQEVGHLWSHVPSAGRVYPEV